MEIIYQYNLKEGKSTEYTEYVAKSEQTLRERAPKGWKYRGTFVTVQGLGDFDVQQRWELDDYSFLGAGWGHDEGWDKTLVEGMGFIDGQVKATVVKPVDEVGILE